MFERIFRSEPYEKGLVKNRILKIRKKYSGQNAEPIATSLALRKAAVSINKSSYKDILTLIADLNESNEINSAGADSLKTALHWAAIKNNAEVFQLLEQNGALGVIPDKTGMTALDYASQNPSQTILNHRHKYYPFFSFTTSDLFEPHCAPFLNYKELLNLQISTRFFYRNSLFLRFLESLHGMDRKALRGWLNVKSLTDLTIKPYFKAVIANVTRDSKIKWLNQFNFNFPPKKSIPADELAIIILCQYLSLDTINLVLNNNNFSAFIFSGKGLILFAKKILNDEIVKNMIASEYKNLFIWILENRTRELNSEIINAIWNKRSELNILNANFGFPGSITKALRIIASGGHLRLPNFNLFGEINNSPWETAPRPPTDLDFMLAMEAFTTINALDLQDASMSDQIEVRQQFRR